MVQAVFALVSSNVLVTATRADTTYSGTLQASLTVSGFLDAEGNPIAKPAGLTLENIITFVDDESFTFTEGDATADADAAIDVVAGDPFDLVAGNRFDFNVAVLGTTVFPTGFSYAAAFGNIVIHAGNFSPNPVTISFDYDYDYAASTSVDDSDLEFAYVIVNYGVWLEASSVFEMFAVVCTEDEICNNDSLADVGAGSFEVTLLPGQSEVITAIAAAAGDPFGAVPEPTSWLLGIIGAATLSGAARRRRSQHNLQDSHGGRPCR
jgi:hypothetical protein